MKAEKTSFYLVAWVSVMILIHQPFKMENFVIYDVGKGNCKVTVN